MVEGKKLAVQEKQSKLLGLCPSIFFHAVVVVFVCLFLSRPLDARGSIFGVVRWWNFGQQPIEITATTGYNKTRTVFFWLQIQKYQET